VQRFQAPALQAVRRACQGGGGAHFPVRSLPGTAVF
jgi:hypothetical protein